MGRIINETDSSTIADADYLLKDNATSGTTKLSGANLKTQFEIVARKGVASGYCGLDSDNLVPAAHLRPSFTIEEVADAAARNALTITAGDVGKRLVRLADTGVIYLANATGSGSSKWTTFNSMATATTSAQGVVQLATAAEALARTSATKAITPSTLNDGVAPFINARAPLPGLVFDGTAGAACPVTLAPGLVQTVELVVNPADNVAAYPIISTRAAGGGSASGCVFYRGTDGSLTLYVYGGTPTTVSTAAGATPVGKATAVALVLTGSNCEILVNGVSAVSSAVSGFSTSPLAAEIGADTVSGGLSKFKGYLELRGIFNRALSAAEVLALYETGTPPASDYPASPAGAALNTTSFVQESGLTFDTFSGASASGFTAAATTTTGVRVIQSRATFPVKAGDVIKATFSVTQNSGSVAGLTPILRTASGTNVSAIGSALAVGANTYFFVVTAAASDASVAFLRGAGNAAVDFTVASFAATPLGLVGAWDLSPGCGLVAPAAQSVLCGALVLPTSGVTWSVPRISQSRVRGTTSTNGNQQLLGASVLPANSQITRIRARSRTGTPTITLGTASGGSQLVSSVALSTTWKDLTIALTGGIVSSNSSIWVGSNSTDVVEIDAALEPLSF